MESACTWITRALAIGTAQAAADIDRLRENDVRGVIDLRVEAKDDEQLLRKAGIDFLHLPTPDLHPVSQEMLWKGVEFARAHANTAGRVLIHCEHGIGRSALLLCCVLVSDLGHSPLSALACLKNARKTVSPSPDQLHALLRWSRSWSERTGGPEFTTTWEDLAAVAYRR